MNFNAFTLTSLFFMLFSAIFYFAGGVTLISVARKERSTRHFFLAILFLLQSLLITSLIIAALSYSLGVFSGSLKTLSKLNHVLMGITCAAGFIFLGVRFSISKNLLFRIVWVLFALGVLGLIVWIITAPAHLVFPANLLEPQSVYLPADVARILWNTFLIGLGMSYILHAFRNSNLGERTLSGYAAGGVLLIAIGWFTRSLAIQKEMAILLGGTWGLIMAGSSLWFLAEMLSENSIYATRPLQVLRSRIFLKLIFLFVLLLVVLPQVAMIGAVHLNQRAITNEVHKNFSARAERLAEDIENHFLRGRDVHATLKYGENHIVKDLVRGKGLSFIVGRDGNVLFHPDPSLRNDPQVGKLSIIQQASSEIAVGEYTGTYDIRYTGAAAPLRSLGWVAVVQEPVSSAYADIQQIVNSNILLVILTTLVTILSGILFAKSIERPIREVIRGTDEVRKGNLSYVIPVQTQDEVGELAGAINQMTRELRQSQEHLIASEKLAALGTMAAGMAHEIKNPLVSLRTFTQLLPQKFQDLEFREKFATIVPQEIEKINKIAENLLKFGRPSKPELKKVDVNEILEDVISLFENECRKHDIRITIKLARLPNIIGDPGQLSQAFINIILNAIQSMENGGELTVKTDIGEVIRLGEAVAAGAVRREASPREMVWGVVEKGSSQFPPAHHTAVIFVEVTDTGPGIPESTLKNIFDPFYTTKAKGTGMGLPITLRIIEEHQGSVKVKSAEGKGTTFIITLPQDLQAKP